MSASAFSELVLREPRLAEVALDVRPAWLFASGGSEIIWANPVAARIIAAGPVTGALRSQIAQAAGRLTPNAAPRLERLLGLGGWLGAPRTCLCTKLALPSGTSALLVQALDAERRVADLDAQLAALIGTTPGLLAFHIDGSLAHAGGELERASRLALYDQAGLGVTRALALKTGRADAVVGNDHVELIRIGSGDRMALIAVVHTLNANEASPPPLAAQQEASAAAAHAPAAAPEETASRTSSEPIAHIAAPDAPAPSASTSEAPPEAHAASEPDEAPVPPVEAASASEADVAPPAPVPPPPQQAQHTPTASFEPPSIIAAGLNIAPRSAPSSAAPYRHPVRFMWQTDAEGRFALGSDEFSRLVGPQTMAAFGRPWSEINALFQLDPDDRVAQALATRDTWSGIVVQWPFGDGARRLAVEMSGLPAFDRQRRFVGYRGFGVCRDLDGLNRLATSRRGDEAPRQPSATPQPPEPSAPQSHDAAAPDQATPPAPRIDNPDTAHAEPDSAMTLSFEPPANVVPFRPAGDARAAGPALSPNENNAFNELARELSERLTSARTDMPAPDTPAREDVLSVPDLPPPPAEPQPDVTSDALSPFGTAQISRPLLDRIPIGILVYRLDHLLYANRAFLDFCGFATLDDLADAGGLDALFVEPAKDPHEADGTALRIATARGDTAPVDARLYSAPWNGESAMALVMTPAQSAMAAPASHVVSPAPQTVAAPAASTAAEELLDLAPDGVVALRRDGTIILCNKTLEAWTGLRREALIGTSFVSLLSQDSRLAAGQALEAAASTNVRALPSGESGGLTAGLRGAGAELRPVTLIFTPSQSASIVNVLVRDLRPQRDIDQALRAAQGEARRATEARNGLLARISHEIRAPLNAIIGFANVMIDGKFGAIGNERYTAYLNDIRSSGESVVGLIDNLLDLSHIETGKAEFQFADVRLNDLVEHCVALMQPQANRSRIIIRSSLTHNLPLVRADVRALRQIVLNLLSNSVALSEPGGQVIVSTALGDLGDVFLRVRDSGPAMSDSDIASAMDPFGAFHADEKIGRRQTGLSLPLTRALAEANKARFSIAGGAHGHGTLIEILFPQAHARVI